MKTQSNVSDHDVRIHGLSKSFRSGSSRLWALADIDLTVPPGTFTAIMGPSGSGKSTLLNCLLGLERPDSGTIRIGGTNIAKLNETQLAELRRSRIGVVFQSYNLIPSLNVADNISLPLRLAGRQIDRDRVRELAEMVGVGTTLARRPGQLSGGQQQRVAFARAIISRPELIVADEPTGALDTASSETVLCLLRSIVSDLSQRVLMVTHDPRAAAAADRVLFISDGRWRGELQGATPARIASALTEMGQPA